MAAAAAGESETPRRCPPPAPEGDPPGPGRGDPDPPGPGRGDPPPGEEDKDPPPGEGAPPRGAAEPENRDMVSLGAPEAERTGPGGAPPRGSLPQQPGAGSLSAGVEEPMSTVEQEEEEAGGAAAAAQCDAPEDGEDQQASPLPTPGEAPRVGDHQASPLPTPGGAPRTGDQQASPLPTPGGAPRAGDQQASPLPTPGVAPRAGDQQARGRGPSDHQAELSSSSSAPEEGEEPADGTPAMDTAEQTCSFFGRRFQNEKERKNISRNILMLLGKKPECSSDVGEREVPQTDALIEDVSDEDADSAHRHHPPSDAEKGAAEGDAKDDERNGEGVDGKRPPDAETRLVKDADAAVGQPEEAEEEEVDDGEETSPAPAPTAHADKDKDTARGPGGEAVDATPATAEEMEAADNGDEEEEAEGVEGEGEGEGGTAAVVKRRRRSLQCEECGLMFSRREMYNLHRYSHTHHDGLDPLTCRECGQTFQQRSGLVKHRSQHRQEREEREEQRSGHAHTKHRSEQREEMEQQHHQQQLLTPPPPGREAVRPCLTLSFKCSACEKFFPSVERLRSHSCGAAACGARETPYRCPLCRQEFGVRSSLTKHMQGHSLESVLSCQECHQSFSDGASLRQHQRCHAALKPYECPDCGTAFRYYSLMEDHRRRQHWEKNGRPHRCSTCGKAFKYLSLLQQHQYLHTGQKPFRCPDCGRTFAFAQNMKAHSRQHRLHGPVLPLSSSSSSSAERLRKQQAALTVASAHHDPYARGPGGKENAGGQSLVGPVALAPKRSYNCPLCPQVCHSPADLRGHMQIHEAEFETLDNAVLGKETAAASSAPAPHPESESQRGLHWEEGHTCPHCPSTFRDEPMLFGHLLRAHNSSAHYLKQMRPARGKPGGAPGAPHYPHAKVVTLSSTASVKGKWRPDAASSKTYTCPECGKTFRHRSVLELHMRIHSKDKPYRCKECGKSFRFSSYLQQHLIIHTGEKPYKCPDCGKDFAFLQNMRTHQKLHLEKPYRCTSCRKGYSDEEQLRQHMLSHTGEKPHRCHLCDKSFALAYLLRDHMNTHTGERPHRCPECHKSFSWFTSLLVHQKIHTRKQRQGYGPYGSYSSSLRMRGRGGSPGGRRGPGRPPLSEWSRSSGPQGSAGGEVLIPQPPPFQLPSLRDHDGRHEWQNQRPAQQHPSMFAPGQPMFSPGHMEPAMFAPGQAVFSPGHMEPAMFAPGQAVFSPGHMEPAMFPPVPVQWKSQTNAAAPSGGSLEPAQHQRRADWTTHPDHSLEETHAKDTAAGVPKRHSPPPPPPPPASDADRSKLRSDTPASVPPPPHDFPASLPYMDGGGGVGGGGAALWSLRPAHMAPGGQDLHLPNWSSAEAASSAPKQPLSEPPSSSSSAGPKKEDGVDGAVGELNKPQTVLTADKPQKPDPAASSSAPVAQPDQSGSAAPPPPPPPPPPPGLVAVSHPPPWDFRSVPLALGAPDFQPPPPPPGWVSAAPQVPFSVQYDLQPPRFPGAAAVWGFQAAPRPPPPPPPHSLTVAEQLQHQRQHQPMVTGAPILLNQPSPFFSHSLAPLPPPPPLAALPGSSSSSSSSLVRHPHPNIFFAPQAVHMHPGPPHHHHQRLPFAPERLLQCMICGGSLPSELDLQVHYLHHAQGKI